MSKHSSLTTEQFQPALAALVRYERRQARIEHPSGSFDKAKRWYPTGRDEEVIDAGRSPSRSYPNSYNLACRSLAHCERYQDADHQVVLRLKRELKKAGVKAVDASAVAVLRSALPTGCLPISSMAAAMPSDEASKYAAGTSKASASLKSASKLIDTAPDSYREIRADAVSLFKPIRIPTSRWLKPRSSRAWRNRAATVTRGAGGAAVMG